MSLANKLQSDWPGAAGRLPFFYGWAIALISTLGFLLSVPGQTMGMAVFAEEFIVAFDLSRTELSTAYLLGTLGSAFMLTRAGRWYDLYGARVMLVAASVGLAATLVFISAIDEMGYALASLTGIAPRWLMFGLLFMGYFGVRFAGQGVLTSASRNVLLVWFVKRRGLVSGVRGVFVSLGFAIAPLLLALMIDAFAWRQSLWLMAAAVGLGFSVLAFVAVRDNPAQCGLLPDGEAAGSVTSKSTQPQAEFTLAQARRDVVFWVYSSALSMHALFGTAVTFHIVAIFGEAGRSREAAFAYFLPSAVVSVMVNLTASTVADRMRLKPLLIIMLMAFIMGATGLTQLHTPWGYWLLVTGFGAGGGLWGVLSNLAFIRQFGALHLGEISGLNTSLTVFASAIGPVLFSVAQEQIGTFTAAAAGCLVGLIGLLIVSVIVRQPRDLAPA